MTDRRWLLALVALALAVILAACRLTPTPQPVSPLPTPTPASTALPYAPIEGLLGQQVSVCVADAGVAGAVAYEGLSIGWDSGYKTRPDLGKPWHVLPLGTACVVVGLSIGGWANVVLGDGRQLFILASRLCP